MFDRLRLCVGLLVRLVRSRESLLFENLALRQQLAVFKRTHTRPRLAVLDKLFWVALRRFWSSWKNALIVVTPDTVIRWHRAGFQLYWRLLSRARKPLGRRPINREIRELIFQMVAENPTWRAPRIHGELVMLGFEVSERSVARWMRHAPRRPDAAQRWLTFLRNHREALAAMDFFSVPTLNQVRLCIAFRKRLDDLLRSPFGCRMLGDAEVKDPWRPPQGISLGQSSNQRPNLEGNRRSSEFGGPVRQTRPVPAEAFSLPAYHRVGMNYDQGFAPVLPHGCERDPEPAVVRG